MGTATQSQGPAPIRSERQRKLQQLTFVPSVQLTRDLPRDTVLKHLQLRLSGSIVTTYASGTPVADNFGAFDNLISRIDVQINGSRTVKNVKPFAMHMQQIYTTIIRAEQAASAAASAATDNYPTADAKFPYGTTTQITTVRETVIVSFENVYARQGKESTWLNLKGVASAEVRLTCAAYSALLGFGNTAPVVYSSSTFVIDILTIEAQDVPADVRFMDWKQTTKQISVSAQQTGGIIDLNRGNKLQALMLMTRDGAAGSATTATGKLANSKVITDYNLLVNGQTSVKAGDFKALQAENRARFGLYSPYASNISDLDGVAYLDLLSDDGRGDLLTALDVSPPYVDNLQLMVNTNTSSNVSYTNPVSIEVMTEELVSYV
jgi:hypothetical protein